jgi:cytochrome b pre-mRNA-processing protein 3
MIFRRTRTSSPPRRSAGRELYDAAVRQARSPALYAVMGAPDTVEGRFELLTAHVILLVDRLAGAGEDAAQSSQALFDTYVSNLDGALREMGVGDLTVGKRMRALGGAFYGRAEAYRAAFRALPDTVAMEAVIGRTVLVGGSSSDPAPLAAYMASARQSLSDASVASLLQGSPTWPPL